MLRKEKQSTQSHDAHEQHHQENFLKGEDHLYHHKNKDCVSYQMFLRHVGILKPLLKDKNKWLTIGDFTGLEASYLSEQNQDATASDISDVYLKEAFEQNWIKKYIKINVEQIDLEENEFDYLFCKEAFHHFPRAYLGLYEMLRVAKKGVIMIEPVDVLCKMPLLLFLKNICDCFNPYLINKIWKNRFSWETVGNYVFKISDREIEKIAMGLGLSCIAFKEMNTRLAPVPAKWGDSKKIPLDEKLYKKLKRKLAVWNFFCRLRIIPYNTLGAIIFKEKPQNTLLNDLRKEKYRIIELPSNPYINDDPIAK